MVLSRHCTVLIWIASLALLWSYQVQGAEVDDSLSYIDTFDYLGGPEGGEYEYEPFLDIPETTKPTVTSPTEPANPGTYPLLFSLPCITGYVTCTLIMQILQETLQNSHSHSQSQCLLLQQ